MKIDDLILKKLYKLAALLYKPQQKTQITNYLKETLTHFHKIKNVDVTNVEPLFSPLQSSLNTREDLVQNFPDKGSLLDQAPQKQGALVKVPPAI